MSWWAELTDLQKIYWAIAIVFSVLLVIQFVLSMTGIDADTDADFNTDVPSDGLDASFTIFSFRGLMAFLAFFGWTGVVVLGAGGSPFLAMTLGFVNGLISMLLVAYIIYFFLQMQHSGTMHLDNAIGQQGEVYLLIPPTQSGKGKISIKIQGTLRELDAVTAGKAIPTGTKIEVVELLDDGILLVKPVSVLSVS